MNIIEFQHVSHGLAIGWEICPKTQAADIRIKQGVNVISMTSMQALEVLSQFMAMAYEGLQYDINNDCLSKPKDDPNI